MIEEHESLAWDYTADEESLAVNSGSPVAPRKRPNPNHLLLSRKYAVKLCHELEQATQILRNVLYQVPSEDGAMAKNRRMLHVFGQMLSNHVLLITLVTHIALVTFLSLSTIIHDKSHHLIKALLSTLGTGNLIIIIFTHYLLILQIRKQQLVKISQLFQLYASIVLMFATVYSASYIANANGWKESLVKPQSIRSVQISASAVSPKPLYAEVYSIMLHTSMLYALPMGGSSGYAPVTWYNCILTSAQMLLCFTHFLFIIYTFLKPEFYQPRSSVASFVQSMQQDFEVDNKTIQNTLLNSTPHEYTSIEHSTETACTSDTAFIDTIRDSTLTDSIKDYSKQITASRDSLLQSLEKPESANDAMARDRRLSFLKTCYGSMDSSYG